MIVHMMRKTENNTQLCMVKTGKDKAGNPSGRILEIMQNRSFVEISKEEWQRQHEVKRALLVWEAQS